MHIPEKKTEIISATCFEASLGFSANTFGIISSKRPCRLSLTNLRASLGRSANSLTELTEKQPFLSETPGSMPRSCTSDFPLALLSEARFSREVRCLNL